MKVQATQQTSKSISPYVLIVTLFILVIFIVNNNVSFQVFGAGSSSENYSMDTTSYIPTTVYTSTASGGGNGVVGKSSYSTYFASSSSSYPPTTTVPLAAPQPILQSQYLTINPQPLPQPIVGAGGATVIPQAYPYGGTAPLVQSYPQPIPMGGQPYPYYAQPLPQPVPQPVPTQPIMAQPVPQPIPQPMPVAQPVPQPVPIAPQPVPQPLPVAQPIPQPVPVGGGAVIVGQPVPQPIPQPIPQPLPVAQPMPQPVPIYGGYGGYGGYAAQPLVPVYGGGGVVYGGGGGVVPFTIDGAATVITYAQPLPQPIPQPVPGAAVIGQPVVLVEDTPPCKAKGTCSDSSPIGNVVVPQSASQPVTVPVPSVDIYAPTKAVVDVYAPIHSKCITQLKSLTTLAISGSSTVCTSVMNCMLNYTINYIQYGLNALSASSASSIIQLSLNPKDEVNTLWSTLENLAGKLADDGYGPAVASTTTAACTTDLSPVFSRVTKGTTKSGVVFVNSCWARQAKAPLPYVPTQLKPGAVSQGDRFKFPDDVVNPNNVIANYYVLSALRVVNFSLYYFKQCMGEPMLAAFTTASTTLTEVSNLISTGNIDSAITALTQLQTILRNLQ
ncbi:hypothetical protein C9374_010171 [Naegleria lovaniensis]|uniref:Uncharacterized protein n=1 Tax=Naegleria lovaniensis TaxID=51637 RepID=A0AA88GCR0_NAELO|nr:uncharacterized protein C9374_010171 [Naegleria lovaniensis]KAG2375167.1 hypothetical protein C9374_010171 [Naegleria lovaniensis]